MLLDDAWQRWVGIAFLVSTIKVAFQVSTLDTVRALCWPLM